MSTDGGGDGGGEIFTAVRRFVASDDGAPGCSLTVELIAVNNTFHSH